MNLSVPVFLAQEGASSVTIRTDNLESGHLVIIVAVILFMLVVFAGYSHWNQGRRLRESRRRAEKVLGKGRRKSYLSDVIQPRC